MERRYQYGNTMTFEEKILGYLDDTLPEQEREEVLHEAHSSREARALLDAHVRLGSLYVLTARPVSAPLDIQRELAAKVPILAVKLPYLAAPEKRRKGIVAWFWESRLNVLLLLLATLLVAGIWYVVSNGGPGNNPQPLPAPQNSTTSQSPTGGSGNSISVPTNQSNASSHSNANGNTLHDVAPSSAASPPTHLKHNTTFHSSQIYTEHSHTLRTYSNRSNSGRSIQTNAKSSDNISSTDVGVKNESVQNRRAEPAVEQPSVIADTFLLPPLHAISTSPPPIALHSAATPIPITISESNNSYTPFRVFAEENIRSMRVAPQAQPSDYVRKYGVWQNSITSEGEEFGIDYELSPWVAVGARGGNARFVQAQPILHTVPVVGSYGRLSHTITETALLDPFAPWVCLSGTYLVNPTGRLQYEFTAGAGDIFLGGFSPTALGEAAATYRISDAMALRASISYQASWTTGAGSISASNASQPSVSGSAVFSSSPKLFASQAIGFSIGVAIHP